MRASGGFEPIASRGWVERSERGFSGLSLKSARSFPHAGHVAVRIGLYVSQRPHTTPISIEAEVTTAP